MDHEAEEMKKALELIKAAVCGDAYPRWHDSISTTLSRGRIAYICDKALGLAPKPLRREP